MADALPPDVAPAAAWVPAGAAVSRMQGIWLYNHLG
jgi:hypothetical protein